MSALWVAAYVRAGGLDPLVATAGGAQQDRVLAGSRLIAERLAAALGERVQLGCPVRRLRYDDGHGDGGVTARTTLGTSRHAGRSSRCPRRWRPPRGAPNPAGWCPFG